MQKEIISKVKGLVNIANKGGYLIIGADNLKNYNKKLYLILRSDDSGKNIIKICEKQKERTSCAVEVIEKQIMPNLVSMENCKVVGIKNLGLAKEILKYIEVDIG